MKCVTTVHMYLSVLNRKLETMCNLNVNDKQPSNTKKIVFFIFCVFLWVKSACSISTILVHHPLSKQAENVFALSYLTCILF